MKIALLSCLTAVLVLPSAVTGDWLQWGGARWDFAVDAELAESWPEDGPRVLWRRPLGNGHAGILADGDLLFTLFGSNKRETVVALDRDTGEVRWRESYEVGYASHRADWDGPHSTPLIVGDRLLTVSIDAQVKAWDKRSGEKLWERDLVREHGVDLPQSGYAASPLAWGETILLPGLGGSGPGILALAIADGMTVWTRHSFLTSHASPILITFAGREQAVFHGMNWIYGIDPSTGEALWKLRLRSNAADNISFTPLWDAKRQQLLVSHRYDGVGARAIRLTKNNGEIRAEELWSNRQLRVEHGNGVILDGAVYASDAGSPGFLVAVDLDTGDTLWKTRTPKANFLVAGDRLLILEENGDLVMARPGDGGVETLGRAGLLSYNAWTVPTLVGQRLYARDRSEIVAVELP